MKFKIILLSFFIVFSSSLFAQTIYELDYNFDVNKLKEDYKALLYCNADGSGFIRVRCFNKENNTETVVGLEINKDSGQMNNMDPDKMFFTGKNPVIIKGDNNLIYTPDAYWFKVNPQTGDFEPSSVVTVKNGREYNAVYTNTKVIAMTDLSKDFVLQYFKDNEAFYENLFPQKSRGGGNSTKGARLHFISATNTEDGFIGRTCVVDKKNTLSIFASIAGALKIPFDSTLITGMEFNKKNILNAIDTIKSGENDIIIFYYSGHGYSKDNDGKLFPYLDLRINPTTPPPAKGELNIEDIYKLILAKKGKVKLVLSDCCNWGSTMKSIITPNVPGHRGPPIKPTPEKCQKLFINTEPVSYIMTAASKTQVSAGTNSKGGFFTSQFKGVLEKYVGPGNEEEDFSWSDIIPEAQTLTNTTAAAQDCPLPENQKILKPCKQMPLWKKN